MSCFKDCSLGCYEGMSSSSAGVGGPGCVQGHAHVPKPRLAFCTDRIRKAKAGDADWSGAQEHWTDLDMDASSRIHGALNH